MNEKVSSLSIFIPAYNAEKTLQRVISRIPETAWQLVHNVYPINDGSNDTTGELINGISVSNDKCKAIHHRKNAGYGATVKNGLKLCGNDGSDFTLCLHADGQYPPEQIEHFQEVMIRDKMDLLQGSRIASGTALSGGMPRYKLIAGKVLTALENLVFRMHLTDYHSGFIMYRNSMLNKIPFEKLSGSFDIDLEMIASARANGFRVGEQPIPTCYADEKSYLNPIGYGIRVLCVLINYCLGRYRI